MYGEDFRLLLDSTDDSFNMIDSNEFINILSDLEEVNENKTPMTIYEFYIQQKMEHAKFLLYEKGMTVTDVSATLGYSSISHFSTAFKRQTGLKPCDLLK